MPDHALRLSTLEKEGALLTSKAIKIPVLLDNEEMDALLASLKQQFSEAAFFNVQGISQEGQESLSCEEFSTLYQEYVEFLKRGEVPADRKFGQSFSTAISVTREVLYAIAMGPSKRIVKATKPLIQLQPHAFFYSNEDSSFRSMVFGKESVQWGVQFSYPQLYQQPHSHEIFSVQEDANFPNTALFRQIQLWIRKNTLPTPFMINGCRKNEPMRLGKKAFNWISSHPQLAEKGISIHGT